MNRWLSLLLLAFSLSVFAERRDRVDQSAFVRLDLGRATTLITSNDGLGSGVLIDPIHVITNAHVVGTDRNVKVWCLVTGSSEADTARYLEAREIFERVRFATNGRVLATSQKRDLAVIRLERPLHFGAAIKLASEYPEIGEDIFFQGNPHGEANALASAALRHVGEFEWLDNAAHAIVAKGTSRPGNSGGPIVNQYGDLIGIVAAGNGGTFVGPSLTEINNFLRGHRIYRKYSIVKIYNEFDVAVPMKLRFYVGVGNLKTWTEWKNYTLAPNEFNAFRAPSSTVNFEEITGTIGEIEFDSSPQAGWQAKRMQVSLKVVEALVGARADTSEAPQYDYARTANDTFDVSPRTRMQFRIKTTYK